MVLMDITLLNGITSRFVDMPPQDALDIAEAIRKAQYDRSMSSIVKVTLLNGKIIFVNAQHVQLMELVPTTNLKES